MRPTLSRRAFARLLAASADGAAPGGFRRRRSGLPPSRRTSTPESAAVSIDAAARARFEVIVIGAGVAGLAAAPGRVRAEWRLAGVLREVERIRDRRDEDGAPDVALGEVLQQQLEAGGFTAAQRLDLGYAINAAIEQGSCAPAPARAIARCSPSRSTPRCSSPARPPTPSIRRPVRGAYQSGLRVAAQLLTAR